MRISRSLVSIIVPTYNREDFISKTLDSFISQTYENWECIVVDDGSTDNTISLLRKYSLNNPRISYYSRPNHKLKGANSCRNYGFSKANGEYIQWFDSDDIMLPYKLEIQVDILEKTTYDYTICQSMMYDIVNKKNLGFKSKNIWSNNIFQDYINFKIFWLIEAPLWRKFFLDKNQISFDEELHQAQDYDYHMKILAISTNYKPVEKGFVIVNVHQDNISSSTTNSDLKIRSNVKVKSNIIKFYKLNLPQSALVKNYKDLLNLYKFCLRENKIKIAKEIYVILLQEISILGLGKIKKSIIISRFFLAFLAYNIFGKGELFIKIKF